MSPTSAAGLTIPPENATGLAALKAALAPIIAEVDRHVLSRDLGSHLDAAFPPDGAVFQQVLSVCRDAIASGWMCNREGGGIRYGRVIKPADGGGYSVDVVDMADVVGPHHVHPNGEIDMIMPLDEAAQFDGHGAGWIAYPPGSAHSPTVTGGRALILYLLPQGAIQFTT